MAYAYNRDRVVSWDFPPGSLRLPLIIAHRGDSANFPENTIPAFVNALALGADGVELDVRLTKDQNLIVFHDHRLGRTALGSKPVNHYTTEQLQALDVGSWFSLGFKNQRLSTLDEVFESLPKDFLINVILMSVVLKNFLMKITFLIKHLSLLVLEIFLIKKRLLMKLEGY